MIWELFIIGGFWFWALLAGHAIWLLLASWKEIGWSASLSLIVFFVLMWLFGNFNIFYWIYTNPITFTACAAVYLVVGVLWSFGKWYLFLTDVKDAYSQIREEFKQSHNITGDVIPVRDLESWRNALSDESKWDRHLEGRHHFDRIHRVTSTTDIIPKASNYKATIIFWMAYWPLSLLWSICSDFIERLFQRIYRTFQELYNRVAQHVFKNVRNDFAVAEQNSEQRGT